MSRMYNLIYGIQTAVQGGDTVANINVATNFASNAILQPNALDTVGRGITSRAWGLYSTDAVVSRNIRIDLMADSTILCSTGTFTPTLAGALELAWHFAVDGSIRTVGAGGTLECHGLLTMKAAAGATVLADIVHAPSSAATPFDTTIIHTIQFRVTWATASVNNSITMRHSLHWLGGTA